MAPWNDKEFLYSISPKYAWSFILPYLLNNKTLKRSTWYVYKVVLLFLALFDSIVHEHYINYSTNTVHQHQNEKKKIYISAHPTLLFKPSLHQTINFFLPFLLYAVFLLYMLFCHMICIDMGITVSFWKLHVSSSQSYLKLILNYCWHVTHSAWSGHIIDWDYLKR